MFHNKYLGTQVQDIITSEDHIELVKDINRKHMVCPYFLQVGRTHGAITITSIIRYRSYKERDDDFYALFGFIRKALEHKQS